MKVNLKKAILIKRYKRFLADITLANNTTTTLHVANTGAMTGCADEGDTVWYSTSDNQKRKYPYSWEFTQKPNGDLICVNTHKANDYVAQALKQHQIKEFAQFKTLEREVKYGEEKSKIDFLLTDNDNNKTYIEVKSVTLLENNLGYFPDAKTTRGQKHLRELIAMVESGQQACLLFFVMHNGIQDVRAAKHIDDKYAQLLHQAKQAGVKVLAYKAGFKLTESSTENHIDIQHIMPLEVFT